MKRILVIDDTPDLLLATCRRLASLGYAVDSAVHGRLGLEAIETSPPDLIVLDVMMPELNGFQVARRVRQDPRWASMKILMLTAKDSAADRFWGESAGADLYLTKPVDPRALADAVRRLIGGPE